MKRKTILLMIIILVIFYTEINLNFMLTFNIFTTVKKKLKQLYLKYLQNRIDSKVTSLSWVWRRSCEKKKKRRKNSFKTISSSHFLQLFASPRYTMWQSSREQFLWTLIFCVCILWKGKKEKRNFSGEYHKALSGKQSVQAKQMC